MRTLTEPRRCKVGIQTRRLAWCNYCTYEVRVKGKRTALSRPSTWFSFRPIRNWPAAPDVDDGDKPGHDGVRGIGRKPFTAKVLDAAAATGTSSDDSALTGATPVRGRRRPRGESGIVRHFSIRRIRSRLHTRSSRTFRPSISA